jgi:hypothetical protein
LQSEEEHPLRYVVNSETVDRNEKVMDPKPNSQSKENEFETTTKKKTRKRRTSGMDQET